MLIAFGITFGLRSLDWSAAANSLSEKFPNGFGVATGGEESSRLNFLEWSVSLSRIFA